MRACRTVLHPRWRAPAAIRSRLYPRALARTNLAAHGACIALPAPPRVNSIHIRRVDPIKLSPLNPFCYERTLEARIIFIPAQL